MGNNSESFLFGFLRNIQSNKQHKKMLERISNENERNRHIEFFPPSPIEDFFNYADKMGNVVLSGVSTDIRNRALINYISNAQSKGLSVVVIHQSDSNLEEQIQNNFNNALIFNRNTGIYDPLIGLSNVEINRMVQNSALQCCEFKGSAQYYLEGLTEFIRTKNIPPYCQMYSSCPHAIIFDRIDYAEAHGLLNSSDALRIRTLLSQGQAQRCDVENYFSMLENQGKGLLVSANNLKKATSLRSVINRSKIGVFDISSASNKLLLNLVMCDIMAAINNGHPFALILNNISISSNDYLTQYVNNSGSNFYSVVCSDDFYSDVNSDEKLFFSVLGKASKCLIVRHSSGQSCEMYAKYIGYYDKQEIDTSYMQSKQYQSMFSVIPGEMNARGIHITTKKEYRVTPETISKLENNECYIIDSENNILYHVFSV